MEIKNLVLTIILFISPLSTLSQAVTEKRISVESIGINKGLSQGMINCIWQDRLGFMWFGTMDGLNRYDGYRFHVFRNNSFDSTSLSGNFITSIFEDSKGRLWIGTALNGLNLFIPETEQFIHFSTGTKPSLSNNTIFSIQEDQFGSIWIGTQHGLNKLTVLEQWKEQTGSLTLFAQSNNKASFISIKQIALTGADGKELFKRTTTHEPHFLITRNGAVWVSTTTDLFKIIPSKDGKEIIRKQDGLLDAIGKESSGSSDILKIIEDTTAGFLYFKGRSSFTLLNEKSGKIQRWNCAPLDIGTGRNQVVFDKGLLWERTQKGLFCFDMQLKKMYHVHSYNPEHEKIVGTPFSLYKDRSGIIWIGSGGYGLLKYNPRNELFHKTATNSITWMSATPAGNILTVTSRLLHFRKDTSGNQPAYTNDESVPKKILNLTTQPDIALQDKQGNYWLHADRAIQVIKDLRSAQNIKSNGEVVFPYFLDKNDRLCYVTQQQFCLVDTRTSIATCYSFPVMPVTASPYQFCQVIYQDANNVFWLGTTEGLFSFTENTQQWKHYKNKPGDETSLSTNIVFSIADDPQFPGNFLWVGTNGGGLNRLSIGKGSFEHIGLKEGLPSMVVYGILSDNDKRLWISTNRGIACLQPECSNQKQNGEILRTMFRYYYEENGLQSNEFNGYAYCKTKDGILFFGGVNGFNYFNPKEVVINSVMPNVILTDLKIHNKSVAFNALDVSSNKQKNPLLSKPIFLSNSVELPYHDNMVSFDFASLDYTAPEKNLYQYKLDGFDEDWIQSGTIHSATYTNLDPGEYSFTVRGSNSDGVWNERGISFRITILTPWYMSWWFRAAVLVMIATLLYVIFQNRLQQKLKLLEIRNGIASDLHDEIGSTLSSVYIYSEVAQQISDDANTQTNAYLKQISADTGNMINALSDIVWTVNAKNDRFENIIHRMRAAAVELFEAKGYNLHLEFAEQLNTLQLAMAKRKHFYLFYKEAINNAAKYADGKNVWITLTYTKPLIHLSVKDDGQGFALSNKRSGNGLATMQKRADELKGSFKLFSEPGKGTGIQLSFPA